MFRTVFEEGGFGLVYDLEQINFLCLPMIICPYSGKNYIRASGIHGISRLRFLTGIDFLK